MRSTFATQAEGLRMERASRTQVVLWVTIGYLLYVGVCFVMESYGRYRFQVQRDSAINQITQRRAYLIAVAQKASALAGLDQWLPYRIYTVGSLAIWVALAIAAGVAAFRAMVRERGVQLLHIKILAFGIVLSSLFVLMLGVGPPLLIQWAWEQYAWLSW